MAKQEYLTSPPKIATMPPGVPYIVGNEAAERFSYYGMNSILTIFLTNVGDQFGESNKHLLTRVFNWFYFSINAGSAFSTLLIPWLLEPGSIWDWLRNLLPVSLADFLVSPRLHSPDVAFGLPGVFMAIATVIFWMGRKKFVHIPPVGGRQFFDDTVPRQRQLPFLLIFIPF